MHSHVTFGFSNFIPEFPCHNSNVIVCDDISKAKESLPNNSRLSKGKVNTPMHAVGDMILCMIRSRML